MVHGLMLLQVARRAGRSYLTILLAALSVLRESLILKYVRVPAAGHGTAGIGILLLRVRPLVSIHFFVDY